MWYLALTLVGLLSLFFVLRWFLNADPAKLASTLKKFALMLVGVGLLYLLLSGRLAPIVSLLIALLPLIIPIVLILHKRGSFKTGNRHDSFSGNDTGQMNITEAYEILSLKPGATREEIKAAHRRLMAKIHPDHGGSNYLAIKLNQAKDLLLKER